jgi:hypothetical protein
MKTYNNLILQIILQRRKMSQKTIIVMAVLIAIGTAGCEQQKTQTVAVDQPHIIDQSHICEVDSWVPQDVSAKCKPGQKIIFLPKRWGSEQLPVVFAGGNCDLRYSVVITNGAVACIYQPLKTEPDPPKETQPSQTAPQEQPPKHQ